MSAPRTCFILTLAAAAASLVLAGCGPSKPIQSGGEGVVASGTALIGGPFQLVNQDGRAVDQTALNGRWSAVFFGYTYCPDVCPTTLQTLAQAKAALGAAAKDLQVVFVSVDPDRDTPAQMKSYLATPAFPQPTLGLTGSARQVAAAAKAYRVFYQKRGSGEGYSVNHSAIIYLMNPDGKFDRVMAESLTPAEIATQIRQAMDAGPKASS
jgi:protein SCO1/2